METLKEPKNAFGELLIEAATVIGNGENPVAAVAARLDPHDRWSSRAVPNRVRNQVLQHLRELHWINDQRRQGPVFDTRAALANGGLQTDFGVLQKTFKRHSGDGLAGLAQADELQQ